MYRNNNFAFNAVAKEKLKKEKKAHQSLERLIIMEKECSGLLQLAMQTFPVNHNYW